MMDCQQAKCRLLYGISSTLQEANIKVRVQEKVRRTECNLSVAFSNCIRSFISFCLVVSVIKCIFADENQCIF